MLSPHDAARIVIALILITVAVVALVIGIEVEMNRFARALCFFSAAMWAGSAIIISNKISWRK